MPADTADEGSSHLKGAFVRFFEKETGRMWSEENDDAYCVLLAITDKEETVVIYEVFVDVIDPSFLLFEIAWNEEQLSPDEEAAFSLLFAEVHKKAHVPTFFTDEGRATLKYVWYVPSGVSEAELCEEIHELMYHLIGVFGQYRPILQSIHDKVMTLEQALLFIDDTNTGNA